MNITSKSLSQSEEMLSLYELQMTSSFRRSFIPIYNRSIDLNMPSQHVFHTHRKLSQTSSRRVSSVIGGRKRDSDASQKSLLDAQNRFSLPAVYKQYRQPIVTTN
jgi:hypothetical protein